MARREAQGHSGPIRQELAEPIGVQPLRRDLGGAALFPMGEHGAQHDGPEHDLPPPREALHGAEDQVSER